MWTSKTFTKETKTQGLPLKNTALTLPASRAEGRAQSAHRIQRAIGNYSTQSRAESTAPIIQRTCACGGTCASCAKKKTEDRTVQTKLTVGPAHDVYEQEADRVADHVMRMPTAMGQPDHDAGTIRIQRRVSPSMSRGQAPSGLSEVSLPSSGGQPLAPSTRQFMEPRFGTDFSQVRVHSGPAAQETAVQIQARAFTHGANIWLGQGATERDTRLMAHELTHVVQQGAASTSPNGGSIPKGTQHPSAIQRDAQRSCPAGMKTITVDLVSLRGSNRNPGDDLDFANTVFRPCCVQFTQGLGLSVDQADSDTWLGGDTDLARPATCGSVTGEWQNMVDGVAAHYGITSPFRVFYVESLTPGARAMSYAPFCATGPAAPYLNTLAVSNNGQRRTLAHEFGHILLNAGNAVHTGHPGGTDNLMEPSNTASGATLEPSQCATIYSNA